VGLGECSERFAHRRAAEPEPVHELTLVDEAAWGEFEGDDQLADRVVRLLRLGAGVRLKDLDR